MFSSKNDLRRLAGLKTFAETSPDNTWKNIPEKKQLVVEEKMFSTRSVREICRFIAEHTDVCEHAVKAVDELTLITLDADKVKLVKEALTKLYAIKERNRLRAIAFLTPLNEEDAFADLSDKKKKKGEEEEEEEEGEDESKKEKKDDEKEEKHNKKSEKDEKGEEEEDLGGEEAPPTDSAAPAEVAPTPPADAGSGGSSVDPNISNLIKTLASSAEGKTGEELVDYLVKIYYAGFEDGKNSGEEEMPAEMPSDSSAQPPADVNNLSI